MFQSLPLAFLSRRAALFAAALALSGAGAWAEPIRHPAAIFAGLDKTTGRIINFGVSIDETVQFGALQVTPRVCNTRPQIETPQTTSFVEVDELIVKPDQQRRESKPEAKQEAKRIFSGWMFAASPGLHGVEHPVYDVWLVDCKGGKEAAPAQTVTAPDAAAPEPAPAPEGGKKRRSRKVEPAAPAPIENQPLGPADSPDAAAGAPPPAAAAPDAEAEPAPVKKKKRKAKPPAAAPAAPAPGFPF